jgi:diguanylate cyclase (GGDEF)-like protein
MVFRNYRHRWSSVTEGPRMGYPDVVPQVVAGLARSWLRAVAAVTFVPGPRTRTRTVLEELLQRLVRALRAEPFDPSTGYRIGVDLVRARLSSPAVLGETLVLLDSHLLPAAGAGDEAAKQRLAELLGQLAIGFTETLRDAAVSAAEEINRAERAAWRRQQTALQRRLQHALLHDPLTGLANRATLLDRLAIHIGEARYGDRLGICVLNLDRFTAVNDTLGHDAGDRLLRQVAGHLRPVAVRHGYLLAHLAADEFALVVPDTTGPEDVVKAAEQALRALPDPFVVDGHRLPVTARAGIVERVAAADPVDLLRAAHIALGWAKTDHHPYAIFDAQRSAADIRRHHLTAAMPAALHNGEFVLDYQPLVRLADRRIVGAEALARWRHPTLGLLGPAQFIGLAEHTGLIDPLGLYLLERACGEAAAWRHYRPRPFVSVNLAPAQLAHPGLAAAVADIIDRTQLPPVHLQLEITESAYLDVHHQTLDQLADLGVRLVIDDFGTGYSSLAYLAELPICTVKLAARFLHGIDTAPHTAPTARILTHVITMCHDLDISVTAEGIETSAQAQYLTELGCDIGQGFHLAVPTDPAHLTRMLDRVTRPL